MDVRRLATSPVKPLLKTAAASALIVLIAFARIEYVRHYNVHSKEAALGEALDPINGLAMLSFFGFGFLTVVLLCACIVVAIIHFTSRRRLAAQAPSQS